jgi:putative methyltransferase (TIGR04325 family)
MGVGYVHLKQSLVQNQSVEYYVLERPAICEEGSRLFRNDPRICFLSSLPKSIDNLDVIHLNSVLQYIDDYKALLTELAELHPKYFLFVRLSAGDVPTYVSAQLNVRGSVIPYRFISINEILEVMSFLGFSLLSKSASEEKFNQENFPERYRMQWACNLLFAADTSTASKSKSIASELE